MSLLEKQFIFNRNLVKLLNMLVDNDYNFKVGEILRTKEQQDIYVKQGKSKTYNSKHLKALAVDITLFKKDNEGNWEAIYEVSPYTAAGEYWKFLNENNRWGGDWKNPVDPYHFEMQD